MGQNHFKIYDISIGYGNMANLRVYFFMIQAIRECDVIFSIFTDR